MTNARTSTSLERVAAHNAETIHNQWGVGRTTPCGGSGLLVYLAVADHQVYLSRGKAVVDLLTDNRLHYVIEKMKPDLREQRYGSAVETAVFLVTEFIQGHRPGQTETAQGLAIVAALGAVVLGLVQCCKWRQSQKQSQRQRLDQAFRADLAKLDRDGARARQGHYQATSCPICLQDFGAQNSTADETNALLQPLLGSDGQPVHVLSCGHVFDQSCWHRLARYRPESMDNTAESTLTCPICRQPVTQGDAPPQEQCNDQAYQDERYFRLQQLRSRYPTFIGTQYVDQWYDPSYRGSLLDDYDRRERQRVAEEERRAAEIRAQQQAHASSGYATSSFGGGSADGGGVGGSW